MVVTKFEFSFSFLVVIFDRTHNVSSNVIKKLSVTIKFRYRNVVLESKGDNSKNKKKIYSLPIFYNK